MAKKAVGQGIDISAEGLVAIADDIVKVPKPKKAKKAKTQDTKCACLLCAGGRLISYVEYKELIND